VARAMISLTMNESSSTDRSVPIAACTIADTDCGSMGITGRNRHSNSWRWPVANSTIGWKYTRWLFLRLKK